MPTQDDMDLKGGARRQTVTGGEAVLPARTQFSAGADGDPAGKDGSEKRARSPSDVQTREPARPSRIGNHEIIWRVDALGLALPSLKHLLPTCNTGLLLIRVKQARGLANPATFGGKQTPYVKLEIGKNVRKTPKLKNAGSAPVWESTQQFSLVGGETDLLMTVLSKRGMSRDFIGRCGIPLEFLLQLANPGAAINATSGETDSHVDPDTVFHEAWFEVRTTNGAKYAGEILLRVQFFPDMPRFSELTRVQLTEKTKGKNKGVLTEKALLEDIRKGGATKGKIKIFGGSLRAAIAVSKHPVPRVVRDCVTYLRANGLDEVGLFRIPGNHSAVEVLKKAFDDNIDVNFESPHDCGALLKLYLRELREPLIPFSHYEHFLQTGKRFGGAGSPDALEDYRILVASLPQQNRDVLCYLIPFLEEVAEHEQFNRMSVRNVAIVFAPNLLRASPDALVRDQASMTADMQSTIDVTESLIRNHKDVFPARPSPTIKHARGGLSRDMRGQSVDLGSDLELPAPAAPTQLEVADGSGSAKDDSKRGHSPRSSPNHQSISSVKVSSSGRDSQILLGGQATATVTSADDDEDEDTELELERRASLSGRNEIEELRKELDVAKANSEALKEHIAVLMLQIEDLRHGAAAPLEDSLFARRQSSQMDKANYIAMRDTRLGQLKALVSTATSAERRKASVTEGDKSKGSSGNLLTTVGRTVAGGFASWGSRDRSSSRRGHNDVDLYEVVSPLRVRDSPSLAGVEVGVLEPGQRVSATEVRGMWLKHETGWSMIQSDPSKDGPKKLFLKQIKEPKKNGTLEKPLGNYLGLQADVTLSSRKDDDSSPGPTSPKGGPVRREALDLKAFMDSRGSSTTDLRRSVAMDRLSSNYGGPDSAPTLNRTETSSPTPEPSAESATVPDSRAGTLVD